MHSFFLSFIHSFVGADELLYGLIGAEYAPANAEDDVAHEHRPEPEAALRKQPQMERRRKHKL